ncbi:MAG: UDP-3-O-(3-hydroxymyristoyl)glucosamine N-acyltransferase [Puniceicoccales bacterium]|jgi:UDP-3-O-[3-hydroxymyristoyl] glucosamine N-acyltransferase|nr:UDP-3-O-(3-hydroxymyristoyl)glucosamine N-acyltransferase [Puniceicoccales bacterium]
MNIAIPLPEILALIAPQRQHGNPGPVDTLTGIAALDEARPGELTFLGNPKYTPQVPATRATIVLLPLDYPGPGPGPGQMHLHVPDPSRTLAQLCAHLEEKLFPPPPPDYRHPTAIIDPTAHLGDHLHIGPHVIIEAHARIGDHTILEAHAHIAHHARIGPRNWLKPRATVTEYCETGARVKIHHGAIIGGEGFGYETHEGTHRKIPQIGNVVLEDDVEIGANTTIDRARFATTRIGAGTKIDNLVQIGHNCRIGRHCILVAQSGLAGSTTLEDHVALAGQVGLAGHLRIGRGARIGAQCGVLSDVPPGAIMLDSPAIPIQTAKKLMILKQRLPELFKRVKALEAHTATPAAHAQENNP